MVGLEIRFGFIGHVFWAGSGHVAHVVFCIGSCAAYVYNNLEGVNG